MNLGELQNLVNYRRRDNTESFISNDEIKEYLNEGNRKATASYDFDWNKTSATFTYTDGSIKYKLSAVASDFNEPINMFYTPDYEFDCVSPQQFVQLSGQGVNMFAVENGDLWVKTAFGTATLTLNYYSNNTAQTSGGYGLANLSASTDEPLMPELYQDSLVDFAAARCYQKEGMYDDYKIAMADYNAILNKMKTDTPSRKKRYAKRMLNTMGNNTSNWASKNDPLAQI